MKSVIDFLQGKKTYIIAGLIALLAVLKFVKVEIPDGVFAILGALGLTTLRSAVAGVVGGNLGSLATVVGELGPLLFTGKTTTVLEPVVATNNGTATGAISTLHAQAESLDAALVPPLPTASTAIPPLPVPSEPFDTLKAALADGWQVHPESSDYLYKGDKVLTVEQVEALYPEPGAVLK